MTFQLPDLPYDYSALEPHMSAETLKYHHDKHHAAYVNKLNELIDGTELSGASLEEIVRKTYNQDDKQAIFNNASQHYNHTLFWQAMTPGSAGSMPSELESKITESFGSVDEFKKKFKEAGLSQFGSGWAWLVMEGDSLKITKTPNGVNPLCFPGQQALLGCDVWEHSYYIDHRNDRGKYVEAFLDNLVNWEFVAQSLQQGGFKAAA